MSRTPSDGDAGVQATNDEAFLAKTSAAAKKYFDDPYLMAMSSAMSLLSTDKTQSIRQPMINRGTFARVHVIRRAASTFLSAVNAKMSFPEAQIISFGAGFDTLPFRVLSDMTFPCVRYVELDFEGIVRRKADIFASSPTLTAVFESMTRNADGGVTARTKHGSVYQLCVCDIRNVDNILQVFSVAGVSYNSPVLFVTECVLVYLEPSVSDELIQAMSAKFSSMQAFISFDPVEPSDPFGRQMVMNVACRGSPFLGISKYPSVESQISRFRQAGWEHVDGFSMSDVFKSKLGKEETKRLNRLEMLDEVEEWMMMMDHYCFVWAWSMPDKRCQALLQLWPQS